MQIREQSWVIKTQRAFLAVIGAYLLTIAIGAALALTLSATGLLNKADATIFASLLGFLLYLCAAIWVFIEARITRIWLVFSLLSAVSLLVVALLGGDIGFGRFK